MKRDLKTGLVLLLVYYFLGCTKDKGQPLLPVVNEEPRVATYSKDIQPLVATKCAVSGCHVSGFPFGDFNDFNELKKRADNGRIRQLVFDQPLMPPASAQPLTPEEKELLKTWLDNGAKQD